MNTHRMLGITMIAALMAQLIPAPVLANSVPVMELRTPQSLLATPSAVTQPLGEPKSRTRTPARDAFVQDEVLVQFKARHIDLRTASGMSAVRAFADAHTLDIDTLIASSNTAVFRTRGNASVTGVVARLRWIPEVLHAQPNFTLEFQSNDALYTSLWALENSGQAVNGTTGTSGKDIDAPEAWNRSEGNNVIVAVIDSGVAFNHPDILANMWDGTNCVREDGAPLGGCQHGYDFEDGDTNPLPTSEDHGTHVAGTIAAVRDNTIGTVGVAPRAKVMALKIGLTTAQEIRAIDFARQNGATIINASWGGYGPAVGDLQLKEAIERFGAAGGIFIAAAGNGSSNHNDGDPNSALYPAAFDSNNIISVAATDQQDGLATFSDYGAVSV
ncbi:S8 family serine peptidase, partial [Candidatus Uhrbacteria bacterium]|nr:S8 family serine peptidase [Candidatus Uhrbacteria bacterium]